MKKWLILLVCLSSGAYAPAAPDGPFEDDYYAEYMDGDYDDLYKYGFRMNNYASVYSDRFVVLLAREYGPICVIISVRAILRATCCSVSSCRGGQAVRCAGSWSFITAVRTVTGRSFPSG